MWHCFWNKQQTNLSHNAWRQMSLRVEWYSLFTKYQVKFNIENAPLFSSRSWRIICLANIFDTFIWIYITGFDRLYQRSWRIEYSNFIPQCKLQFQQNDDESPQIYSDSLYQDINVYYYAIFVIAKLFLLFWIYMREKR